MQPNRIQFASLLVLNLLITSMASAREPGQVHTEKLLQTFQKIVTAPSGQTLTPAQVEANQKVYGAIDDTIDFSYLTSKPLEKHQKAFSKGKLKQVKEQFEETIRRTAYPAAASLLQKAKITYSTVVAKDKSTDVLIVVYDPDEDMETELTFHWHNERGRWSVRDLSFDGSSLVKDYENQFTRIIKKDGAEALARRIQARLDRLTAPTKKEP